jgi:hypothetical protein
VTFYNTAHAEDRTREKLRISNQERIILGFFQARPFETFTPAEVQSGCPDLGMTLLTSVRRAVTDLTDMGLLEKTRIMRDGGYGVKTHTWRLAQVKNMVVQRALI